MSEPKPSYPLGTGDRAAHETLMTDAYIEPEQREAMRGWAGELERASNPLRPDRNRQSLLALLDSHAAADQRLATQATRIKELELALAEWEGSREGAFEDACKKLERQVAALTQERDEARTHLAVSEGDLIQAIIDRDNARDRLAEALRTIDAQLAVIQQAEARS